ncbi:gliding motility lipoprotein GldD [Flavobacterium agricola]|uniref:Gliding motility lipoprotein GldD n=1 Tax=Flavobacterium agricola TaxID=2870839 RepID=A0ABY6LXY4_9FLAO|nr:gliding motility lipoprotein GldD [Flavobacterium agricola]UYW00842.1 gliding motility lipoprotein GldD [Flavobacterium agricola]
MKTTISNYLFFVFVVSLTLIGCKDATLPKPKAQLRLSYPNPTYNLYQANCGFEFDVNHIATVQQKQNCSFEIEYPKMKATIYMTYLPVNNDIEKLLSEAQKLTYEHVIKADDIVEQPFINPENNVYGMFYYVGGNAATNTQFYATDSTKHFIRGSAYFYATPNFDSILPAVNYIKNDMRVIMESLQWQ